jgi:hypothetical protein
VSSEKEPAAAMGPGWRLSSGRPQGRTRGPGHNSSNQDLAGAKSALMVILAAGHGRSKRCRAISTGRLRGLPRFHLRPIDVVVYHGSRRDLVLRRVSRLDAFSGYPGRT